MASPSSTSSEVQGVLQVACQSGRTDIIQVRRSVSRSLEQVVLRPLNGAALRTWMASQAVIAELGRSGTPISDIPQLLSVPRELYVRAIFLRRGRPRFRTDRPACTSLLITGTEPPRCISRLYRAM